MVRRSPKLIKSGSFGDGRMNASNDVGSDSDTVTVLTVSPLARCRLASALRRRINEGERDELELVRFVARGLTHRGGGLMPQARAAPIGRTPREMKEDPGEPVFI